jgi:hypothetical protein
MKTLTIVIYVFSLLIYLGFGIYLIKRLTETIRLNRKFHRKALIRITNLAFTILPLIIVIFMARQLLCGPVSLLAVCHNDHGAYLNFNNAFALFWRLAAIRFYYYLIH